MEEKRLEGKLNYLNVGCGDKYHKDWVNIDIVSNSPDVISYNLLKGIPFPDEEFEIVYQSQVLEHFQKDEALSFIKECNRVLKKNGTIRIVVPDLENIVDEYKKNLNDNLKNPSEESEANYDWIMLEMYDQIVRNYSGGQMMKVLQQPKMANEQYVINRIGHVGRSIRNNSLIVTKKYKLKNIRDLGLKRFSKKVLGFTRSKIINLFLGERYKLGDFRLCGETHSWMYDRYSLTRLLLAAGFREIRVKSAFESDIPNWGLYELDVKGGLACDPQGLFIEAQK